MISCSLRGFGLELELLELAAEGVEVYPQAVHRRLGICGLRPRVVRLPLDELKIGLRAQPTRTPTEQRPARASRTVCLQRGVNDSWRTTEGPRFGAQQLSFSSCQSGSSSP